MLINTALRALDFFFIFFVQQPQQYRPGIKKPQSSTRGCAAHTQSIRRHEFCGETAGILQVTKR